MDHVQNQGAADRGQSDQLVISRASAQDSGAYTREATSARGQQGRGSANLYITRKIGSFDGRKQF